MKNNEKIIDGYLVGQDNAEVTMEALKTKHLDEVTIETLDVKIRYYKEEVVMDDENEPLLDALGQPHKRRIPKLRTAKIQNMVTVDDYHEAMNLSNSGLTEAQMLDAMTALVLRIWQRSEERMERKDLVEGIDFEGIAGLFARFFERLSQQK